jgi:NAD(P)-dependent dehydrogenase (short-subunit alcohol dehydrogenase family)
MGRLAGKCILVTGAGGNLGSAMVRAYLDEGARVVLTSRRADRIDAAAREAGGTPARAVAIAADLNDEAQIDHLAAAAWNAFGGIDAVVLSSQPANPKLGDLITTSDDDWRSWFQTIVWGPLRLMRQLAPRMMEAGGGSVITVTSSTGDSPEPGFDAYGLGKAGLWWLTRYMAKEWGPRGIRANALQPGLVATAGNFDELEPIVRKAGLLDRTALGRLGRNEDCLGAAVFLASDESAFISGQRICVDGGRF